MNYETEQQQTDNYQFDVFAPNMLAAIAELPFADETIAVLRSGIREFGHDVQSANWASCAALYFAAWDCQSSMGDPLYRVGCELAKVYRPGTCQYGPDESDMPLYSDLCAVFMRMPTD